MPREIAARKINDTTTAHVVAIDEMGPGGASHAYHITYASPGVLDILGEVCFQKGPIKEAGITGVMHEDLLAILIDRLQAFQRGPFACRENALALTKLEEALHWLEARTRRREAAGVEGTHKPAPGDGAKP